MDIWDWLWAIYFIVAGLAMIMTYREQIRNGHRILVYRVMGFMACAAWPLSFPLVALAGRLRGA